LARVISRVREPLPGPEREFIESIEAARRRLSLREEPLVDGTLEAGPYDDDVTIKAVCRVSKKPRAALLLYLLVRELKPLKVIELGTNVGISAAYLAAGLKINGQGHLVTLEASAYRLRLAREVHESVGLSNVAYVKGLFTDTLESTLREVGPVDFAFIDGHHQYQPTLDYLQKVHGRSISEATYVFDDIDWSEGMARVWAVIQRDPRIAVSIDLNSVGICLGARADGVDRYTSPRIYNAIE
jgi:predicted O-methyltransferase YrrM